MVVVNNTNIGCILASLVYIIQGFEDLCDLARTNGSLKNYAEMIKGCGFDLTAEKAYITSVILPRIFGCNIPKGRIDWQTHGNKTIRSTLGSSLVRFHVAETRIHTIIVKLACLARLDMPDAPWKQVFHDEDNIDSMGEWAASPMGLVTGVTPEQFRRLIYAIHSGEIRGLIVKLERENFRMWTVLNQIVGVRGREGQHDRDSLIREYLQRSCQILKGWCGSECDCHADPRVLLNVKDFFRQSTVYEFSELPTGGELISLPLIFHSGPMCQHLERGDMAAGLCRYPDATEAGAASAADFCQYLYTKQTSDSSDSTFDLNHDGWTLRVKPTSPDPNRGTWTSLVSLTTVLDTHVSISTKQKLRLARDVARYVLYFYHTPWLQTRCTSGNIYFIRPYIGDIILSKPLFPFMADEAAHGLNSTLLDLGIILIELSCGATSAYIRKVFAGGRKIWKTICGIANDDTIAPQDRPFYHEGPSYFEAVCNCISPPAGYLEEEQWRLYVIRHVIQPLEFALEDYVEGQSFHLYVNDDRQGWTAQSNTSDQDTHIKLFDNLEVKEGTSERAKNWFADYDNGLATRLRKRPSDFNNRVRVAILDTGVDPAVHGIKRPLQCGRVIFKDFAGGPDVAHDTDEDKHGTAVTSLLLHIAPNADVYVGRVTPDGERWDLTKFCEAIRWAYVEKKVHIISMSLGLSRIMDSNPIRKAILDAHAADVLVFAAAHNDADSHPISFPASMDEVICVGSTDGVGNKSDFSTKELPAGRSVSTVGEGVLCFGNAFRSGNSYATPIAAGIAAAILDFMWPVEPGNSPYFKKLRTQEGMICAFEWLKGKTKTEDVHRILIPWFLFERNPEDSYVQHLIIGSLNLL